MGSAIVVIFVLLFILQFPLLLIASFLSGMIPPEESKPSEPRREPGEDNWMDHNGNGRG